MSPEPQRTLPAPLGAVLSRLPAYPGSLLLVAALNFALARHLPDDVGRLLLRKHLCVHVRDARLVFDFTWTAAPWVPLAGAVAGAVLALAAGWWGLREVLLRPVVDTLRRSAE